MQVRKYEKTTNYKFCAITNKDKKEKDSNNSSSTSDLWNSRNRNYDKNDISNNLNVYVILWIINTKENQEKMVR